MTGLDRRPRRPLRVLVRSNRRFGRLFAAHAVSRAGDAFNTVALVVLVFELTGSGTGVAGTVAFEVLPVLAFGPMAGVLVDRYPQRRVMVIADVLRAGLAAVLVVFDSSLAAAYLVAFGLSSGSVAFNPAVSSLLPEVVDEDDLVDANSAMWTVAVVAQIVLAPTAGAVIVALGVPAAFAINSASYVLSAVLLSGLPAERAGHAIRERAGWSAVAAGIAAVRSVPLLRRLAAVQVLASLAAGATGGLLVVLAAERLDLGPSGFGLLLAAIGVGAALGPTLFRTSIRPGDRRWLFGPFAVRGTVDLALGFTTNPIVAGAGLGAYGMSTSTGMVAYQATLQTHVPAHTRGRAFALFDVLWNGARLVSLGLGGLLADAVGIRAVYLLGGVLLLAAAAVGLRGGAAVARAGP